MFKGEYVDSNGNSHKMSTGDTITMILNCQLNTLSFILDDYNIVELFKNVNCRHKGNYKSTSDHDMYDDGLRLAVTFPGYWDDTLILKEHFVTCANDVLLLNSMIDTIDTFITNSNTLIQKFETADVILNKTDDDYDNNNIMVNINTKNGCNDNKSCNISRLLILSERIALYEMYATKMEQYFDKMNHLVSNFKNKINSELKRPQSNDYKKWNINDIMCWIHSLENGRFSKYTAGLRKKFIDYELTGEDLIHIKRSDLQGENGIKKFRDRIALEEHIRNLGDSSGNNKQEI